MIQVPQTIESAIDSIDATLDGIDAVLNIRNTLLSNVSFIYTPGPSGGQAASVASTLDNFLNQNGIYLAVHPWTAGVAETGSGRYSQVAQGHLSVENALAFVSSKLLDPEESVKDDITDLFCCYVSAVTEKEFLSKLEAFNLIFPFYEFQFCQRRIKNLISLETEKLNARSGALWPRWKLKNHSSVEQVSTIKNVSEKLNAFATAALNDNDPIADLEALITGRQAEIQATKTQWDDLVTALSGSQSDAFIFEGSTAEQLATLVKDQPAPLSNFCVMICLAGTSGTLNFFKELFDL